MKKRFLLITLMMCILGGINLKTLNAQDVVTIGDGTTQQYYAPFDAYSANSGSQTYYLSSEIGKPGGGTIDKISYNVAIANNYNKNIKVYMRNTEDDCFPRTSEGKYEMVNMTNEDLVFEGIVNPGTIGWMTIDLTNDFNYEGKNLLIAIYDATGASNQIDAKFNAYSSRINNDADYRTIYKSGTSGNPVSNYTVNFSPYGSSPNIQLTITDAGSSTPTAPDAPVLVSPTDGTTISGTTVDLSWNYGANNTATHYQVLLGTDEEPLSVRTDGWVPRAEGGFAIEDVFNFVNLEYGKTYYWRVDVKNGEEGTPVEGEEVWSFATAFEFIEEGNWNEDAKWNSGTVPGNGAIVVLKASATINAEDIITVKDLTITEDASLTINGSLNITGKFSNTDASKLVINDGGQIFQKNAGVQATFNMSINNPTVWSENNINGWQFISSPFTDAYISDFVTTGVGNDYDLYKFDGKQVGAEWVNHKQTQEEIENEIPNDFETTFQQGRGYLASYQAETTATLKGTLNESTELDLTSVQLSYGGGTLADIYLIGNPFPFDMDMSKLEGCTWNIIAGYAVVDGGSYSYDNFLEGTIPAGDGFFVKVEGDGAIFYYNHNSSKSRNAEQSKSLNITATGNAGKDNVVINFAGKSEGFPKLQNFNDAIATVYVQNNDVNYAIFNCNEDVQEIELCFNANQMGNYTISAQPEGKFETVTLVDRFTGIETNLLVEDYRFTAMSEENNNRFFIRLGNGQQTTDNSHFAYVSGEDLIIEAEGTVQIIDMMGRVVYTSNVENNNRINVSEFNNGAYVVRVINENEVKVEKIIL